MIHPNSIWLIRWWDRLAHHYIGSGVDLCYKLAEVMGEMGNDYPSHSAINVAQEWEEKIEGGNLGPWK